MDAAQERERAERKEQLLYEGTMYRSGIVHAKAHVKQGLRPDALVFNLIGHAGGLLRSRLGAFAAPLGVTTLPSLLPIAVRAVAFLRRRRLVKPALGVGAAVAVLALYSQRHRH